MRLVWWPAEIRRLNQEISWWRERYDSAVSQSKDAKEAASISERMFKVQSEKATALQKQIDELKEQAVLQKQERRAIYEQRDEARRLLRQLAHSKSARLPEWVEKPIDRDGNFAAPVGDLVYLEKETAGGGD